MAHELEHENDDFWENLSLENLFNDIFDNSDGDKTVLIPEEKEKEEEKKRSRSATKKGKGINGEKKEGDKTSNHETHIWTERERRKKMSDMFSNLHSLLPQLPPKTDKLTIVDEAMNYIKTLQSTLERLEKQKLERLQGGSIPTKSGAATSTQALLSTRETFMADQVSSMNNSTNARTNNFSASASASASASHLPVIIQTWTSSNVVLNICGNDAHFAVYTPKKTGIFSNICFILDKYKLETTSVHISSDVDRCVYMIQVTLTNEAKDQLVEMTTVEEIYKQVAGEIMMCVAS